MSPSQCHCGYAVDTREALDEHMQRVHGAPPFQALFATETLVAVRDAARALKAAEDALIAARQTYAEAVKAMSEEAVK